MLTGRQQEIWKFLTDYVDDHGYPPTVREIGEQVGLASPSTVHAHLANLERAGYLKRDPTKPRALELTGLRRPDVRSKLAQPAHKIPPALMVAVSSEGRVFHVPGCKYLHKREGESPELMTASNAIKEGYVPCARCLRQYLSAEVECPRSRLGDEFALRSQEPVAPPPGF